MAPLHRRGIVAVKERGIHQWVHLLVKRRER